MINNLIAIGKILKSRGLKGEFKVDIYSKNFENIKNLKIILIDEVEYSILSCSIHNNFAYLRIQGIETVEQSEAIKNKEIFAKRESLIKLPDNLFYIVDLIGCEAVVGDEVVGVIIDIYQEYARDIYVVKGKTKMYIPIIDNLIKIHDLKNKQVVFNKEHFYSVMVENWLNFIF